jgi:BASS family bile acid:Na+ symporter
MTDPDRCRPAMNAVFVLMKVLAWTATIAVMFGGALRLGPVSLRQVRKRPKLFLRMLVAVWLAIPLLTIGVVLVLDVQGLSATTLLLMAICPGMPLLLASTGSVKGAIDIAFVALLLTATTEPLLIPYWTRLLRFVHPGDLTVEARDVVAVLIPTVFIPVAVGFAIRQLAPRAATTLARVSEIIAIVGIVMDVLVVLIQGAPVLAQVPVRAFAAAVVVTVGDTAIGYLAGWPNMEDQKAIAMASALGNPALALAVMEASFPGLTAGALISVYLLIRALAMVPLEWWLKRSGQRGPLHRSVTP